MTKILSVEQEKILVCKLLFQGYGFVTLLYIFF